ncbi:hypothetical protein GCM10007874_41990 [Labrys miyagiensis]|uniref:Glycosyltransferase n=1 Tax=Labrys miyagiensis TaxID=346912 RepID=A0ABQ6CLE4_9HYPH|nr:glycosyltransferase family 4 protein [Labrys miyagiensis]GLS21182.1 hypothetical protein GCM10007874_41990 [Labrys miyagiensis]
MPVRILFVTAFPPFPIDRSGGAIRSRLLLDALGHCGEVGFFYLNYRSPAPDLRQVAGSPFNDGTLELASSVLMPGRGGGRFAAHVDKAERALGLVFGSGLAAAGLRVSHDASRAIGDLIDRKQVDLIVGRLSRPTAVAGLLDERRVPLILDADDWEPSRTAARIRSTPLHNLPLRAYLHRYLQGSDYLGARLLERAEHAWLASEIDTSRIARPNVTTLPNLPLIKTGETIVPLGHSDVASKVLFAVGQWTKGQNSDGMKWFLRSVWPRIVENVPQAELRIGGDVPEALARDWGAQPKVRVLGFVEELRSEYESAALIATPMIWGGGTKIKVLEAFAHGRVPMGPDHAFDGLADAAAAKAAAIIENDATRLATATVSLLTNPEQRFSRESAAAEYYQKNYSLVAFNEHVRTTVESVMQRKRRDLPN